MSSLNDYIKNKLPKSAEENKLYDTRIWTVHGVGNFYSADEFMDSTAMLTSLEANDAKRIAEHFNIKITNNRFSVYSSNLLHLDGVSFKELIKKYSTKSLHDIISEL